MMQNIQKELASFMEQSKKSQRQISKETGLSTSVISQFLDGTYNGNNEKVCTAIKQYLTVSKERLNNVQGVAFYQELYNTKEVLYTCKYAHIKNDITLIAGDAGAGKTTALEYYKNQNVGVIMVTANSCTTSATAILKLIAEQIGKQMDYRRSVLMNELVTQLKESNRLIIIDEADHLTLQALQAVRNLNDQAKVGIVLSGNDKIYRQMLTGQKGHEFDQIRTRIIVRKRVENNYTVEEMQHIFQGVSESCLSFLIEISNYESLRTAIKLYEIALEFAETKKEAISLKVLKETRKQLFGGM
ncbi:MAG: AAA family ATPase [Anaerocolumna sp.]